MQQHAIGTITECQVQMLAHRKQGPVLPTLIINIVPDPATDKLRKRRSSRTAGLTTTREAAPTTLWFRPGDDVYSLHDWARFIQQLIPLPTTSDMGPLSPLSPLSPTSPTFANPFSPRSREPSEMKYRPGSQNQNSGYTKGSSNAQLSRDRPLTFSGNPSLRSRRSDLSSQTGSMSPSHLVFQHYSQVHTPDLPSPATTIGEYNGEFIEGWTSAQGRAPTASSPVWPRDSVGSQFPTQTPSPTEPSNVAGPRETILDRAFQMRCIPGSEREIPGEEKLSSLARFEALMMEADEKRRQREEEEARARATSISSVLQPKSAWDPDNTDSDSYGTHDFDEGDESDDAVGEMDRGNPADRFTGNVPPSSRRPLHRLSGQDGTNEGYQLPARSSSTRTAFGFPESQESTYGMSSFSRPRTGYSSRPAAAQRTHSQPQLAGLRARAASATPTAPPPLPYRSMLDVPSSVEEGALGAEAGPAFPGLHRTMTENRHSVASSKRLSFTEFTRRLSSTSSLLLVQTNNSGASSRGSNSDVDQFIQQQQQQQQQHHYHNLNPRAPPQPQPRQRDHQPESERDNWEKRCGWRGSIGVFGAAEGGFL